MFIDFLIGLLKNVRNILRWNYFDSRYFIELEIHFNLHRCYHLEKGVGLGENTNTSEY
jgi:hypothetical protein